MKESFSENVVTFFRSQNDMYLDLMWNGLDDIERRTGCQKPCIFKKYSFPGDKQVVSQISIKCASMTVLKLNVHYIWKYQSCPRYQMCTAGDLNEIKYLFHLPYIIFSQILYLTKYLLNLYQATSLKSDHFIFSLVAASNYTNVETEHLIYPLSSLVVIFLKNIA